jgi:hypothetical protein
VQTCFTMTRAEVIASSPATLRAAILAATGSESGSDSIMRSLERMGSDPSIEFFEMTEVSRARRTPSASPKAWRVRADRGRTVDAEE